MSSSRTRTDGLLVDTFVFRGTEENDDAEWNVKRRRRIGNVPGPLTLRMMERVVSSMNSTRTWVTPPREPVEAQGTNQSFSFPNVVDVLR